MNYFIKKYQDCLYEAFIYFTKEEIDQAFEFSLSVLQKDISHPGFRKGKVPFEIIEKNYANDLNNQVFDYLIKIALSKFEELNILFNYEPKLKPYSRLKRNSDFLFSIIYETIPEIKNNIDLSQKLVIEYDEYYIDDKTIEDNMKEKFVKLTEVNSKIEENDFVTVTIKNLNNDNNNTYEFEAKRLKKLIGNKVGDVLTLNLDDLEDYITDFIKYDIKNFEVKIEKIERYTKQEITDEVIQQYTSFKTVNEYKEYYKNNLQKSIDEINYENKKKALKEYIYNNISIEISKKYYIDNFKILFNNFLDENFSYSTSSLIELLNQDKFKNDLIKFTQDVLKEIKFYIALKDLSVKLSIEPSQEVIDSYIKNYFINNNTTVEEYKKNLNSSEYEDLVNKVRIEETFKYLLNHINFKGISKKYQKNK